MFYIKIAELIIKIDNKYMFVKELCKDYIIESDTYDFCVCPTEEEVQKEHDESLPIDYPIDYCESVVVYRLIALNLYKYNSFVLHGATIRIDEDGFIFLAKSGVGKSTHINLYKNHFKERMTIINGDKPIIKEIDGKFFAYGTPYNGKERLGTNDKVEIKGLCFLKRGEINKAYDISKEKASILLFNQILLPNNTEDYDILISLLDKMISKVKLIQLECNMLEEACEVSYKALGGTKYEN